MSSLTDLVVRRADALEAPLREALEGARERVLGLAVRGALIGGSLVQGRLFWVRATFGQNQLSMHDCTRDGDISIGGVPEQLYGEGFLSAWHEVLARELGDRAPAALYNVGFRGACWEVGRAIDRGVWVPGVLRPLVGKPMLVAKMRESRFYRVLMSETLRILFRMIMTEGGWGRVEVLDLEADPVVLEVENTPEPRRLGQTGKPSCHLMTGIYAGYFATIFGLHAEARETRCRCAGDERCRYEITLG